MGGAFSTPADSAVPSLRVATNQEAGQVTISEEEATVLVSNEVTSSVFSVDDHAPYVRPTALLDYWLDGIRKHDMRKRVVVKFVLVDLAFWRQNPTLAWLVQHIVKTEDGLVHSALQVGPHLLHWFDGSLVHTKELHSDDALLALDVGVLDVTQPADIASLRKLANQVILWNATKHYDKRTCTCQHFVASALRTLGLSKPDQGEIGVFLKKLKRGEATVPRFRDVEFHSHAQLDQYCRDNLHLLDDNDRALLKSFDRAFWLRHNHQKYKKDPSLWDASLLPDNCFFQDPSETGSFPAPVSTMLRAFPQPPPSKELLSLPPIRVLCMDGGGMRGVILIEMIRQLEARTGKQVDEMFDLVAGTSTGGILAAALAVKKVGVDGAEEMYRNLGKKVFGYSFGNYTLGAIRTLQQEGFYDGQQLREIIEQVVGEHVELGSLHDLRVKLFVVSAQRRDGRLGPFIFRTYGSSDEEEGQHHRYYRGSIDGRGITFAQALLATSAAPGYLPSVQIGEHEFIDGGVVANNPTEIAIFEAMRLWPGRRISVVSLGTGEPVTESSATKASKKAPATSLSSSTLPPMHKSVEPLFDIIAAATDSEQIHQRAKAWLNSHRRMARYVRLNPPCPAFDLAACKDEELDQMVAQAKAYLAHGDLLNEVVDLLSA